MAVLGLGIGLFYPTATTAGVTAVDEARRSLAGAIIYMFQIAGGSVGLGLTTAVFIGASDRAPSGSGFIDGIQTAFTLDAAIAVGGFLIAAFLIQGRVLRRTSGACCSPGTPRADTVPRPGLLLVVPRRVVGATSTPAAASTPGAIAPARAAPPARAAAARAAAARAAAAAAG